MTGYEKDDLATALKGADLIVIPAGVPRKPGMTRDDLFNINAGIVKTLIESTAEHAPNVRQCAACAALQSSRLKQLCQMCFIQPNKILQLSCYIFRH